ncbi:unnamed protein product [Urochloa decumbens]|uniref:Uncharacterized protein n=1 Tax=Urochloa decumbens TaxID=240449 RepID=A0ABC8YWM0_9POAL
MDNTIRRMVHLAPCNTEHGNFQTSLWSLVQLPNFKVPSVFVSSLKQLFLFLGTENLLQQRNSVKVILDSCVVCIHQSMDQDGIHQSMDQDGGSSVPLHYLYRLLNVTLYCMLQSLEPRNEPVVFVVK